MAGIELQYDDVLSGTPGELTVQSDRLTGSRVATIATKEAVPGESVTLTIDSEIQYKMEQVLTEVVERFKAKKAFGVVLDPRYGRSTGHGQHPRIRYQRVRVICAQRGRSGETAWCRISTNLAPLSRWWWPPPLWRQAW